MSVFFINITTHSLLNIQCFDQSTHNKYSYFSDVIIPPLEKPITTKCIIDSTNRTYTFFPDIYIHTSSSDIDIKCEKTDTTTPSITNNTEVLLPPTTTTTVQSYDTTNNGITGLDISALGLATFSLLFI